MVSVRTVSLRECPCLRQKNDVRSLGGPGAVCRRCPRWTMDTTLSAKTETPCPEKSSRDSFLYLVEIRKTNRAHLTNCGVFLSTVKVVGSLSQAWVSKPRTVFGCRHKIRKQIKILLRPPLTNEPSWFGNVKPWNRGCRR